jgi:hypothetical protein
MFTWLLRIPNTSIYMSFTAAQDHNKAVGRDTTLSMPSSTRREDPAATMRRCSRCFAFACRSFGFDFACREVYCLKVVELVSLLLVINYVVDLMMCVILVLCMIYSYIICLFWMLAIWGDRQNRQ